MRLVPLCLFYQHESFDTYTSRPAYMYLSDLDFVYARSAKIEIDPATSKWVHFEPSRREEHDGVKINYLDPFCKTLFDV